VRVLVAELELEQEQIQAQQQREQQQAWGQAQEQKKGLTEPVLLREHRYHHLPILESRPCFVSDFPWASLNLIAW
jgi:hypothetical protein